MHIPYLESRPEQIQSQDLFFGLNHSLRLREGEFYDMENLSSDLFPVLSPRKPRGLIRENCRMDGMIQREGLAWVEEGKLYLNGRAMDIKLDGPGPRQLVNMGAYLLIFPDKKYFNTANPLDHGSLEAETITNAPVIAIPCNLDGSEIVIGHKGKEAPQNPADQSYWLDTVSGKLKQYASATELWVVITTPYVKLQCAGMGKGFSPYDGVEISGDPKLGDLAGATILYGCGEDYLIFPGLLGEKTTFTQPVKTERKMPIMDFVVESGNRLWGCRYGPNDRGEIVNEIYCSKLGDFKNFRCFLGISTDSYTASLGSDGPFTGAAAYGGYPIFFKENSLHKVFGQRPANFQIQTTACRGVSPGCASSLAIVREVLYYKAVHGICAYDGSLPREVSVPLGMEPEGVAVAAGLHGKYYVSMEKAGEYQLYVYDTVRNLWHKEDKLHAKLLCACREDVFCLTEDGRLLSLLGTTGQKEKAVSWMGETGIIGVTLPGNKYLGKISLRMQLSPGSWVSVEAEYDSSGQWEHLGTVQGMSLRSFQIPVIPRRCDHLRLRLRGRGRVLLFAAARSLRPGSAAISD